MSAVDSLQRANCFCRLLLLKIRKNSDHWFARPFHLYSSPSSSIVHHVRNNSSHTGYRRVLRIYERDEKIPLPGEKRKRKIGVIEKSTVEASSSATLFNTVMSEIMNNKNKKKIALEGIRLIEDALLVNLKMEKLFLLKSLKEVPEKIKSLMNEDVEIQKVEQKHMQLWSAVTTPPGVIGIFPKPTPKEIGIWNENEVRTSNTRQLPLTVICDNLREPGNLGSILRSAAGAGCKQILLSKGSVDPWEAKVLRGGSGAQFRIPIISDIPMFSIGSHLEFRSAHSTEESFATGVFIADSDLVDTRAKFGIPSVDYTAMDYTKFQEIYLFVGGETEGIGDDTLQIISSLKTSSINSGLSINFSRIYIPLQKRMESLNVANALGIITFEIRRQFEHNSM